MQQYIGFRLHQDEYAISIMNVREIIEAPGVTPLPGSSPLLKGVTNLRGSVLPVLNVRKLMEAPENGAAAGKLIVVAAGRLVFGVPVDAVTGVMTIEASAIEPPSGFSQGRTEQIEGVVKHNNKLVLLLNVARLLPAGAADAFIDAHAGAAARTAPGEAAIEEIGDAKTRFQQKEGIAAGDPRLEIFDDIMKFMAAAAEHRYDEADGIIMALAQRGQGGLLQEVGRITRRLHDSLKGFSRAVDQKLAEASKVDMAGAVDMLQFVITRTDDAAHRTMALVEKRMLGLDELADHIRKIKEPAESAVYLKNFKNSLEDDLTEIITTQSFQDLTGQTIKKVIELVGDMERELVGLLATFGMKTAKAAGGEAAAPPRVNQADVDALLAELGF